MPARQSKLRMVGAPRRPNTVLLESGKTHEETIDLVTYVNPPAVKGPYQLSIELDIAHASAPSQKGATYWTGKVRSNELEISFGK